MAITDSDLREIYANAPVVKDQFEVISLEADWFSQNYYLQNVFVDGVTVTLDDGTEVLAEYAPMSLGQTSSNADMSFERTVNIQMVNDKIANEMSNYNPDVDDMPTFNSRVFVMYRDGSVSSQKTSVITTEVTKVTRSEQGASITTRLRPVSEQATGIVANTTLCPMLAGF